MSMTADTSDVLADAVEVGSGEKFVHFADSSERSNVIDRFLALAVKGQLSADTEKKVDFCEDMSHFVRFMAKYECDSLKPQLLVRLLEHLCNGRLKPMQVFAVASALDSTAVCIIALKEACNVSSERSTRVQIGPNSGPFGALIGDSPVNPGTMSLATSRLIRPDHMWALNRAWALGATVVVRNDGGWGDPSAVSRNFGAVVAEFQSTLRKLEASGV